METLKKVPLIRETGARLFLGMGTGDAFRKTQVEVSYMDAHEVKHYFCTPTHGHRPKEGSNEAMTDTRVLKLLGVQPKIGTKFTVTLSDRRRSVRTENGDAGVCSLRLVGLQRSFPGKQCDRARKLCEKRHCRMWRSGRMKRVKNCHLTLCLGIRFISKKIWQAIRDCGFQSEVLPNRAILHLV